MSEETKEFLTSPRGKALIKLGLYLVFFVILFAFMGFNNNAEGPKTPLEKYLDMNNYKYTYSVNGQTYSGIVCKNINLFTLNGIEYYVSSNVYQVSENGLSPTELDKLYYINNHDIMSLVSDAMMISKSENYENMDISIKYSIDNIYITLYEKDKTIYKVVYDNGTDIVEINYMNIGEVEDFTMNYE